MRASVVAQIDTCAIPCFQQEPVARLCAEMPSDAEPEDAHLVLAAVADKNRLKVLHALRLGGELCVCDVAHVLGITVSTASYHLRKLRSLRILAHRNDGKLTYDSTRDRFTAGVVNRVLLRAAA